MNPRRISLLGALKSFAERAAILDQNGNKSTDGRHWLSSTSVLLSQLSSRHVEQFERLAGTLTMPLSGSTLGPAWERMQLVLAQAVSELTLQVTTPPVKRPKDILDRLELIVADAQDSAHILRGSGNRSADGRDLMSALCNELQVTQSANRSRLSTEADAAVDAVRVLLWEIERHYSLAGTPGVGKMAAQELIAANDKQEQRYILQRAMVETFRAMREEETARGVRHPTHVNITAENIGAVSTGTGARANVARSAKSKRPAKR